MSRLLQRVQLFSFLGGTPWHVPQRVYLLLVQLLLLMVALRWRVSARPLDIDCNAVSSYTISNTSFTPVRFTNCSQRIKVYVTVCGVSADNPLTVEVVGGITVPSFVFSPCLDDLSSIVTLANMSFTIRGVRMLCDKELQGQTTGSSGGSATALKPGDLKYPMESASALFMMNVPVISLQMLIVDSLLTWLSVPTAVSDVGHPLLFSTSQKVSNVNISVQTTTLLVWSNTSYWSLIYVEGGGQNANVEMLHTTIVCSHIPTDSAIRSSGAVQIFGSLTDVHFRFLNSSFVLDAAASVFVSLSLVALGSGFLNGFHIELINSNFTGEAGRVFRLVSLESITGVGDQGVSASVQHCNIMFAMNLTDASLTTYLAQPIVCLICVLDTLSRSKVAMLLRTITFTVVVNYEKLSHPLTSPMTTAGISVGGVLSSLSSTKYCTIDVRDTVVSVQEFGIMSVAPHTTTVQVGVGIVSMTYALVSFFGGVTEQANITIANSVLVTTRTDASDSKLSVSSNLLSGVLSLGVAVVQLSGSVNLLHLFVLDCRVSSSSTPFSKNTTGLSVWSGVSIALHGAIGSYIDAEFPALAYYAASVMPDDARASHISHSSILIARCSVSGLSSFSLDSSLSSLTTTTTRLSIATISLSNVNDSTVLILNTSSVDSGGAQISTAPLATACVSAMMSVGPTASLNNVTVHYEYAASNFRSILCASGVVSLTNVAMHVRDTSLLFNAVGGSDAITLAPTSNAFQSTLRLSNVSMRFTSLASRGFRSLFANITGGTARISNNMMFTKGPVFVSLPSCSSNRWDGGALSCADMLRPVDGQRAVDWSLVRMSVDDPEDSWCARCPGTTASLTLIERRIETHSKERPSLLPPQPTQLTRTTAAVTTAALALAMLTSSSGVASVLPRLQGMVGSLKLASRCAAQSEAPPTEGSHEDASDSNYAANDVSDNPFLLRLPSTEPSLAYAAGALVGNTLLVIAVAVVSHLAHRWERWAHQELHNDESSNAQPKKDESAVYSRRLFLATISTTFCRVLPTTPLPASLMQLQGLLLQPVVAAAVACIASSDRGVLSVMLAVVIGSAWIAVPCVFMWLLCVKYSPLPLITIYSRRTNAQRMRWKRGGEALEWLCAEREEWVAARGRAAKAAARHVKLRLSAVFAGYRGGRHWYLGVDAFQSVLTGAIVGTAQSVDASDACSAVVWGTACVGTMAAVTAVLCIVLRPYVVRFELLAAVVVSLLAVLAAVLILADDVNGAAIVSLVAAAMELLPLVARLLWNACLRSRKSDDLIESNSKGNWDVNSGSLSQVSPLIFSIDVSARGQRRESKTLRAVTVALSPSQEDALIALVECICGKSVSSLSI